MTSLINLCRRKIDSVCVVVMGFAVSTFGGSYLSAWGQM